MKKTAITIALAVLMFTGCKSMQTASDEHLCRISWLAFCSARGYSPDDHTYEAMNEYFDTWCGSVEEEKAYRNAGIKNY